MRWFLLATALCLSLPACGSANGGLGGSGGAAGTGGTAGAGGTAGEGGTGGGIGAGGTGGSAGEGGTGGAAGEGGTGGVAGEGGTGGSAGTGGVAGESGTGGAAGEGGTGGVAGESGAGGAAGEGGAAGAAGEGGAGGLGGAAGTGGGLGALPDFTATVSDIQLEFNTTVPAADLLEDCASADSGIDIVRFSGTTHNLGPADVVIGDPGCPDCEENPSAVCDDSNFICAPADGHGHGHYQNFAAYELLDETGQNVVAQGHKQGFCLRDSYCSSGSPTFDCEFQGLTAGCSDIYDSSLGCQYIEITGVPAGNYRVRMTSDPLNLFVETNETNNAHSLPVTIPSR